MLVTDAMRAATMPEGPSILGAGTPCIIEDGIAKMPDRSGFAGSVATADRLVRTLYKKAEIPLPTVIDMITKNPAKAIGLRNKGSVLAGYDADLVIFDDDVNISKIFVAGKAVNL
jgi:N-acetylglucosamine-6-phosphate deacetylase